MRKQAVVMTTVAAMAIAGMVVIRYKKKKERQSKQTQTQQILRKFARECATPVPKLWKVAESLVSDMEASLSNGSQEAGKLNMFVSYVAPLPNGDEKGVYYGVNLRGTNFLILGAKLGGKNEPICDLHREEIPIPSTVLLGISQELLDYVASELAKFVSAHAVDKDSLQATERKLGFTLSYPVDQAAATSGSAFKWKCFSADDAVGKALANDFNQTLERYGLKMRVFALVDDTTANLAGGRYYNKDVVAAVTLALGTNAAYLEPENGIAPSNGSLPNSGDVVISTEWGNFNSIHLPVTEFDASLDAESSNPGGRIFEKLISGMYLGEIVRRVLLTMAQETSLFGDSVPTKLATPFLLKSPDMAAMHQDTSENHEVVAEKLKEVFGITGTTPMAREVVTEVCEIVAERGARLAGAGIVAIIKKLGRIENKKSVVTVEGGLYDHYRVFRNYLQSSVWEMLGNDLSDNVILEQSHGGSGAGAIFLAASQTRNPYS